VFAVQVFFILSVLLFRVFLFSAFGFVRRGGQSQGVFKIKEVAALYIYTSIYVAQTNFRIFDY
jgi:hypothetical protein